MPALALVALAVVAAVVLAPKVASAAGELAGSLIGPDYSKWTIDQLMDGFRGKTLAETPREVIQRLQAHARTFDAPPPRAGPLGRFAYPAPPGHKPGTLLVRRNAAERDRDLGGIRPDWGTTHPGTDLWFVAPVEGQKDWGILGTGISLGALTQIGGVIAAPFTGGASLGVSAAGTLFK